MASGVRRRSKKGFTNALFQPFTQLQVSWRGKNELKTLTQKESSKVIRLKGEHLFCGLYANELLVRVLQPHMPVDGTWELYSWLLDNLATGKTIEPYLRLFEKTLLTQLGYELPLTTENHTNTPIHPDKYYQYIPTQGFSPVTDKTKAYSYPGALLLAYACNQIDSAMLPALKHLNRQALAPLLGNKPLKSRALFRRSQTTLSNE